MGHVTIDPDHRGLPCLVREAYDGKGNFDLAASVPLFHIYTLKFPHIEGEYPGDPAEGDYFISKGLCSYLKAEFYKRGFENVRFDYEDWGWWFGFKGGQLAIYNVDEIDAVKNYAILNMGKPTRFSIRRFSKVEITEYVRLNRMLEDIFNADEDIALLSMTEEYPL